MGRGPVVGRDGGCGEDLEERAGCGGEADTFEYVAQEEGVGFGGGGLGCQGVQGGEVRGGGGGEVEGGCFGELESLVSNWEVGMKGGG